MTEKRKAITPIMVSLLIALAASKVLALDAGFAGSWVTTVDKPDGSWEVHWNVSRDGNYHTTYKTLKGQVTFPDEYGTLSTDGKTWHVSTKTGRKDGGQIQLNGDTLVTTGGFGRTTWTRSKTPAVNRAQSPARAQAPRHSPIDGWALLPESRYLSLTAAKPGLAGSSSAQELFKQGMALKNNDRFAEAAGKFSEALSADPSMLDAHMERGVCLTKMTNESRPEALTRALPYCITGGSNLYHMAIGDFTHVIKLQPNNAKAFCMRGIAKVEVCAFSSAIQDFDRAIALKPNYGPAYANRAIAKIEGEQPQTADADLAKAYSIDPGLKRPFNKMRAEAFEFVRDLAVARERARVSAMQGPGDFTSNWDAVDQDLGKWREDRIERGIDSNPSNSPTHYYH